MRQRIIAPIFLMLLAVPSHAQAQLDAAVKAEINKATKAIEVAPTAINYAERGRLYSLNKMYQYAVDDYTRATKLLPREPGLYVRRALQFEKLRDFIAAISDDNQALDLSKRGDHNYMNALRGRAVCYDALGRRKEMLADLNDLIDLGDKGAAADLEKLRRERTQGPRP
jgi:tetratricopeptide (TPR) repeat protein